MVENARQRVDKWLFFARLAKSRSLAARLVEAARVRVNGVKIEEASHLIRPGDVLTVALDRRIGVFRVLAPGDRRGPYPEARRLYEDLSPEWSPAGNDVPDAGLPVRDIPARRKTRRERDVPPPGNGAD